MKIDRFLFVLMSPFFSSFFFLSQCSTKFFKTEKHNDDDDDDDDNNVHDLCSLLVLHTVLSEIPRVVRVLLLSMRAMVFMVMRGIFCYGCCDVVVFASSSSSSKQQLSPQHPTDASHCCACVQSSRHNSRKVVAFWDSVRPSSVIHSPLARN